MSFRIFSMAWLGIWAAACGGSPAADPPNDDVGAQGGAGGDDGSGNADGDCLTDGEEIDLGTDPNLADSDADGTDDCSEIDCGSNPIDAAQACYACGWKRNDPKNLVSTGAAEGDVIENLRLVDQCGEEIALWDFAQEYHILFMTAAW